MSREWTLDLVDGSSISRTDGTLTVVDCHGQQYVHEVDDDAAYTVLRTIAEEHTGISNLWGPAPVRFAHLYTDATGSVVVFVYTHDRSAALAPVYLTGPERKELADVIRR